MYVHISMDINSMLYAYVVMVHVYVHILVPTVRDALQTLRDGVPTQKYPV